MIARIRSSWVYSTSYSGENLKCLLVEVDADRESMIGTLMTLVFLPGIREESEKAFLMLAYVNFLLFLSFRLVSWVSAIRKVALADPMEKKVVKDNLGTQAGVMALPSVFVIMPCHREPSESLLDSVMAVLNADYPSQRLRLFLSFDGFENKDSFQYIVKELEATFMDSTV